MTPCPCSTKPAYPSGPIYSVADMMVNPHFIARGLFEEVDVNGKALKIPAMVPKLSETPGRTDWAGPEVGAFNDEIYGELLGSPPKKSQNQRSLEGAASSPRLRRGVSLFRTYSDGSRKNSVSACPGLGETKASVQSATGTVFGLGKNSQRSNDRMQCRSGQRTRWYQTPARISRIPGNSKPRFRAMRRSLAACLRAIGKPISLSR